MLWLCWLDIWPLKPPTICKGLLLVSHRSVSRLWDISYQWEKNEKLTKCPNFAWHLPQKYFWGNVGADAVPSASQSFLHLTWSDSGDSGRVKQKPECYWELGTSVTRSYSWNVCQLNKSRKCYFNLQIHIKLLF